MNIEGQIEQLNTIYGELNQKAEVLQYKGGTTNTATVHVNDRLITVDANIDVDELKAEYAEVLKSFSEVQSYFATVQAEILAYEERFTQQDSKIEAQDTKISEQNQKFVEFAQTLNNLDAKIDKVKDEVQEIIDTRLIKVEEELKDLNTSLNKKIAETKSDLEDEIQSANDRITDLENRLQDIIEESLKVIKQAINELSIALNNLKKQVATNTENITTLFNTTSTHSKKISNINLEIADLSERLDNISETILPLIESKIQELSDKVDVKLANLDVKITQLNTKVDTSNKELTEKINNLDINLTKKINTTKSELSAEISTTRTDLEDSISTTKSDLEQEISTLSSNVDTKFENVAIQLDKKVNDAQYVADMAIVDKTLAAKAGGMYYDSTGELDPSGQAKSYWYMTSNNSQSDPTIIAGPYNFGTGGGGGGGGGTTTTVSIVAVDWPSTVAVGASVILNVQWSSLKGTTPTGNGTLALYIGGTLKNTYKNTKQGLVELDVSEYIVEDTNSVEVRVTDAYSNTDKVIQEITAVNINLTSAFDPNRVLSDTIKYIYTPYGKGITKLVHFIVDDEEIGTQEVKLSAEQQSYDIKNLTHGSHTLRVYFDCTIGGNTVVSNELFYDLMYEVEGYKDPIITSTFEDLEQEQYTAFTIPYRVYTPDHMTSDIKLIVNSSIIASLTVDQDTQQWEYRPTDYGTYLLVIQCGETQKRFNINVSESSIEVEAVKEDLKLYLTATGRSNAEAHPEIWEDTDNKISCTLSDFNFVSDGWLKDDNGNTMLRVTGDARVEIPYKPFKDDFRTTGKTIELEFATSTVKDYETAIISCVSAADTVAKKFNCVEAIGRKKEFRVAVDAAKFKEKVGELGSYLFTYTDNGWTYNDELVSIADYGITLTEYIIDPEATEEDPYQFAGDTITVTYAESQRGFYVTPQIALLKSQQSELSTQYKEDEHVRVTFVVEKSNETHIIFMYINGVMSGAFQYPTNDNFRQLTPVNITIGSNEATVDIYNIRIYDNNLNRKQVVNNWIADTQSGDLKKTRYLHNDNYNDSGEIVISKLPSDIPYIIWDIDPLPQYKGDKRKGQAYYVDPTNTKKSFTLPTNEGEPTGDYNVQGTSSSVYPVKNIRLKSKSGFVDNDLNVNKLFYITDGGIGANYFTYKVDYASSEGCNNVELVRLYNDLAIANDIKNPAQKLNSKVRVGIDGFPIVAFHRTSDGVDTFCTKANFNNDKANEDVYGFVPGDESWEITNNSADEGNFKKPATAETFSNAFEIRYPDEDGYSDLTKLGAMTEWVVSTDPLQATDNQLSSIQLIEEKPDDWDKWYTAYLQKNEDNTYSNLAKVGPPFELNKYYWKVVEEEEEKYILLDEEPLDWTTNFDSYYYKVNETYKAVEGTVPEFESNKYYVGSKFTYTSVVRSEDGTYSTKSYVKGFGYDTADYRQTKFKAELADWFDVDSTVFYYIFTHLFLLVDSRAKNAFPTYFVSRVEGDGGNRWFWLPYDMDTAIGINNEGKLVFDYNLEDTDKVDGANVFNGQDSVMWCNLREMFDGEIGQLYSEMRTSGSILCFDDVSEQFENHQAKWSESIFNEDSYKKYIVPLIEDGDNYLEMLQGSKSQQRKWWLFNRFKYFDSKYLAGDAKTDVLQFRAYAKSDISIIPYADIYATVSYANSAQGTVSVRASRGQEYTLPNPLPASASDQETYIYSASQLKSVGDLSPFKPDTVKAASATRLQYLKVGDGSTGYENPNLKELTLGKNTLLKVLDVRNCTNLTMTVDLQNCTNIEEIYFDNTQIAGLQLPSAGILKVLHLPDSITNLTLRNQPALEELEIAGTHNVSTLCIENIPAELIDVKEIIMEMPTGGEVRLIGFEMNAANVQEIYDLYNLLDTMTGLNAQQHKVDTAQVSGTIYIDDISYSDWYALTHWMKEGKLAYQDITIVYTTMRCTVTFYNERIVGEEPEVYNTQIKIKGEDADRPTPDPTRESSAQYYYEFRDWDKDFTNVQTDLNIYAEYNRFVQQYEFNFDLQSTIPTPIPSQIIYYGDCAVRPEDPTIEGATFDGWFNDKGGTDPYDFATPITGPKTIYAHWTDMTKPSAHIVRDTAVQFTYTLTDNIGITGWAVTESDQEPTEWNEIEPQSPYVGQYTVDHSSTYYVWGKDASGKTTNAFITAYPIVNNLETGSFTEVTEGELVLADYILQGSTIQILAKLDEHYENLKFYVNDFTTECTNPYEIKVEAEVQVKTECNPKTYTVTFDMQGMGTQVDTQYIVYNHLVEKPDSQYVEGYILEDWYREDTYTTQWNFNTDTVDKDTVLYAKWVTYTAPTIITINVTDHTQSVWCHYSQRKSRGVEVDWGDGSPVEVIVAPGDVALEHPYGANGEYDVRIRFITGESYLGTGMSQQVITPAECITGVEFAYNMAYTANYAFNEAINLKEVELSPYMTQVAMGMFRNCTGLEKITMYDSTTIINYGAFEGCTGLKGEFKINDRIATIGEKAFLNCSGITKFTNYEKVTYIGAQAFSGTGITEFEIPAHLTKLESSLFESCHELTDIDIPETVVELGTKVFNDCPKLSHVIVRAKDMTIGEMAFNLCPLLKTIGPIDGEYDFEFAWDKKIPAFAFSSSYNEYPWITYWDSIVIPEGIEEIGTKAFQYSSIKDVTFPTTLTKINDQAFYWCTRFAECNLPANLTYIGLEAFNQCEALTSIDIPFSVLTMDQCAFKNCFGLRKANIYFTTNTFKADTVAVAWFNGCSGLLVLHIQKALESKKLEVFGLQWSYYYEGKSLEVLADL